MDHNCIVIVDFLVSYWLLLLFLCCDNDLAVASNVDMCYQKIF